MRKQFNVFLLRWALNSLGLLLSVRLLANIGASIGEEETFITILLAGLVFSLVNSLLKPIVLVLSLPAIILSLGLFILFVNGLMVWVSVALVPGIEMTFAAAIVAGIIMSLVNYIVTGLVDIRSSKEQESRI